MEFSDMRERVAEGGSSWETIEIAPSTGIERQEVKVLGGLFGKSVGKASEEVEAPCAGVRGERPLRAGVPRRCGERSMRGMVDGEKQVVVLTSFSRSLGRMCGSGH